MTIFSAGTLPIRIKCLEDKTSIDPRVIRFTLTIGSVINMDGTAVYEAVAAIFIAQANNMELTMMDLVVVAITAAFASVAAGGVPQGGMVSMAIVLRAIGLSPEEVSLIIPIDWLV